MNRRVSFPKKQFCPAFSLVEVVLALGVVSFAVITMLALVPTSMTVYQQAEANNVETQIVQKVSTELQNAPYHSLFNPAGVGTNTTVFGTTGERFYDMEGDLTNGQSSPNPAVYAVTMTSYPFTNVSSGGPMTFADGSGNVLAQTVQFNIVSHSRTNTFSALIVNKGY